MRGVKSLDIAPPFPENKIVIESHVNFRCLRLYGMIGADGSSLRDHSSSTRQLRGRGRLLHVPVWIGLVLGIFGLAACDVMPGVNDDASEPASSNPQISLLEPGQMVTGMSGSGPLRMRTVGPGKKNGDDASFDATHACTMTLYRPDGPRGPGYYHRSAKLSYPDSVLARADGETMPLKAHIQVPAVPHPSNISVRLRCRLPDVQGAEKRVRRFFRVSPEQLREGGFKRADSLSEEESGAGVKGGDVSAKGCDSGDAVVCVGTYCGPKGTWIRCSSGGGGGGNGSLPGDGGSSGGNPPKFFREPDANTGPTDEPDPGGNPCESDNPPDYCDEAGSCYDQSIDNSKHRKMLRAAERSGALLSLWVQSDPNKNPSDRKERVGVILQRNGKFVAYDLPSEAYESVDPCRAAINSAYIPEDAIALIHTQPYFEGENVPCSDFDYDRDLSNDDYEALDMVGVDIGVMIDGEGTKFFGSGVETHPRCGY